MEKIGVTLFYKICRVCKKKFNSPTSHRITCSKKCDAIYKSIEYKERHKIPKFNKICKYCRMSFQTHNRFKIYCSKECVKKNVKERNLKIKGIGNFTIFKRDNFTCIYCGRSSIKDGVKLVIDHIYPFIAGGKNEPINLITSCESCNTTKSDKFLKENIILDLWERNKNLLELEQVDKYDVLIKKLNYRRKK